MKKGSIRRPLALILCAVLLLSLATACSAGGTATTTPVSTTTASSTAPASTTPASTAPSSPIAEGETVKITLWYAISGASGEAFQAQIDAFNASQKQIAVEGSYSGSYADTATKVSAALMSGTEPNVALMAAGPLYTGARDDYSIETAIEDADFDKSDIFDGVWEYAKYSGRICAIPYGISTQVLYYNKNITDAAGLDPAANPPKSWEEFLAMAKTAQEKGNAANSPDFWGFDTSDAVWLFKSMLSQNGNTVINVDASGKVTPAYDDAAAAEVGTFWKSLVDEGLMPAGQHDNAEKKFLAGNLAFIAASSNRISRWQSEAGVKLGAIEMPYFKNQSMALGGNVLIYFPKEEKADYASWQVIKYLANSENQTSFALNTGYLPIRKSGVESKAAQDAISGNALYSVAFNQLSYAWAYWHFNEMGTMDSILYTALESIETGTSPAQDALTDGASQLNKEMAG